MARYEAEGLVGARYVILKIEDGESADHHFGDNVESVRVETDLRRAIYRTDIGEISVFGIYNEDWELVDERS
jgi:hypothetical protein